MTVAPGLQQPDKIVAVTGSQYNGHVLRATPNPIQL
jgi:hypothetical protein